MKGRISMQYFDLATEIYVSIDDFYLTRAERKKLGEQVHPLMETRGVPGTHDVQMLATCIEDLKTLVRRQAWLCRASINHGTIVPIPIPGPLSAGQST